MKRDKNFLLEIYLTYKLFLSSVYLGGSQDSGFNQGFHANNVNQTKPINQSQNLKKKCVQFDSIVFYYFQMILW